MFLLLGRPECSFLLDTQKSPFALLLGTPRKTRSPDWCRGGVQRSVAESSTKTWIHHACQQRVCASLPKDTVTGRFAAAAILRDKGPAGAPALVAQLPRSIRPRRILELLWCSHQPLLLSWQPRGGSGRARTCFPLSALGQTISALT